MCQQELSSQCSLLWRMVAIFYDGLCVLSLFFLATMILVLFTDGLAIGSNHIVYDFYLLLIAYLYFVWHWVNGGQTLGMLACRIRVVRQDSRTLGWCHASLRFVLALLSWIVAGFGFLWSLFDNEALTFHDRFSGTRLVNIHYL